jgi:hypothetical protein
VTGLFVFELASPEGSTKREEIAGGLIGVRGFCRIGGVAPDGVCAPEAVSAERAVSGSSEREACSGGGKEALCVVRPKTIKKI